MGNITQIANSVKASGLVGAVSWLIAAAASFYGVPVPWTVVAPAISALTVIVAHFVPDSYKDIAAQLNVKAQDLADWVPTVRSGPGDYPDSKK